MKVFSSSSQGGISILMSGLLCLSASLYAQPPVPQQVKDWQQAAQEAAEQNHIDQAAAAYAQIIRHYPHSQYALEAHRETAALYIQAGRLDDADVQIQRIRTDYASHPDVAESLYWIGRHYGWNGYHDLALQLHHTNAATYATFEKAMWSQVEVVYDAIGRKDWDAAQAAYELLLMRFADQPTLPKEIWQISREYDKAHQPEKALALCRYNAETYRNTEYGAIAQGELVVDRIGSKDFAGAEEEYKRLLAHFDKEPMLPREIYRIAGTYAQAGQMDKSFELYQFNSTQHGDHDFGRWSGVEVVLALIRQKQFSQAEQGWKSFAVRYAEEPTLSKELYIFGREFLRAGDRIRGYEVHRYNADHHGDTDHGRWSAVETVFYFIDEQDYTYAAQACLEFIQRYADHPDVAMEMRNIIARYADRNRLSAAQAMCETALMEFSDHPAMIWMQHGLILAFLDQHALPVVDDEFARLLSYYAANEDLANVVVSLGRYCCDTFNDTGLAIEFYNRFLNHHSAHPGALDVMAALVEVYIETQSPDRIETTLTRVLAGFDGDPRLAEVLNRLGNNCRTRTLYETAIRLHQAALTQNPNDTAITLAAYEGIGRCFVRLGDDEAVDWYVDTIISELGDLPEAARAVFLIGEEHYFKAREFSGNNDSESERTAYRRSIAILGKTFQTAENTHYEALSHYTIGLAYWYMGEYFEAADAFLMSIDKYPSFEYADAMHWMIAHCYEKMKRAGQVDPQDADAVILWAYETFFEDYHDSRMVWYAAWQLARVHVQQGRPVTATGYLYWLMDYEAEHGYRYTTPQANIDDLLRRLGNGKGCGQ